MLVSNQFGFSKTTIRGVKYNAFRTGLAFDPPRISTTVAFIPDMMHPFASNSHFRSLTLGMAFGILLWPQPGLPQQPCVAESAGPLAEDAVTIRAVGDVVLGSDWPQDRYPRDFDETSIERLYPVLGSADVVFGNFEGALTTHGVSSKVVKPGAVFAFRMPPRFAALLRDAGFGAMHISNNHTFDFGETGYRDTLDNLASSGILAVGELNRVAYQEIRGVKIAWVGLSYTSRQNSMHDTARFEELMLQARSAADIVIVSVQAGAEGSDAIRIVDREELFLGEKRGNVVAFARRAVDLGADLVLGHGPHVLRGMECHGGKLIAYSLGNFVGYEALSSKRAAALSVVLEATLAKDRRLLSFKVEPMRFDEERFPLPDPDQLALHFINELSRLAPLTGTVQLPITASEQSEPAYRHWRAQAGIERLLFQSGNE